MLVHQLPFGKNRKYDIKVFSDKLIFEGEFWYLKDKEFYRHKSGQDQVSIDDFLGMGFLEKRSYRKCLLFVVVGTALEVINTLFNNVNKWIDGANVLLRFLGTVLSLPEWISHLLSIGGFVCFLLGVVFFFSKKKVIEISFTSKRICVPAKSMSNNEFYELHKVIKSLHSS